MTCRRNYYCYIFIENNALVVNQLAQICIRWWIFNRRLHRPIFEIISYRFTLLDLYLYISLKNYWKYLFINLIFWDSEKLLLWFLYKKIFRNYIDKFEPKKQDLGKISSTIWICFKNIIWTNKTLEGTCPGIFC